MRRLHTYLEKAQVNQSQAREAIYRVLMNAEDECLSVSSILDELPKVYPKKVSLNTVYRHLNLFVSCNLAVVIQDDFKKAYYCLTGEEPLSFIICKKCHRVEKCISIPDHLLQDLEGSDFITIHKKCKNCRQVS